jgi:hypothetical protein
VLGATDTGEKFTIQRISTDGDDAIIFEGTSLKEKRPFKASYMIDDQGELHPLKGER